VNASFLPVVVIGKVVLQWEGITGGVCLEQLVEVGVLAGDVPVLAHTVTYTPGKGALVQ